MIFFARWTPAIYWSLVSKPVSQDIQSICYCLHTGTFRLDTRDLLVAGVPISISSKYLYLYLALKVLTKIVHDRKLAVFVSCVLCLRSAFCVMLGTKTMLGTTENMEFINILSLNTIFVILQVT